MKKLGYVLVVLLGITAAACKKENSSPCNLPSTQVPEDVTGNWVSGFTNFTQVIDVYNGQYLGNTWQSGKYLHLERDGKHAELYIMFEGQGLQASTKAEGTVTFDEDAGTFQFHVCKAHYKGWSNGSMQTDRDATASEKADLTNNLQFYYGFAESGGTNYLQLVFVSEPGGSPTSFRQSN